MLLPSEVKSISLGDYSFENSFIFFKNSELFIHNMYISKYQGAKFSNHDEVRDRKLLLKKSEIKKISKEISIQGITLIPLEVFTMNNKFKLKFGICRGKKNWDKKESTKTKDIERENKREGIKLN
jgi:SsrA-binding protein